jgi:hypothetical protein
MVYCSQCGEKNPDGAKYCFKCGAHLIYEKDIEDDSKKSVHEKSAKDVAPRLKNVKLVGDDVEHLESLSKENFQKDMDTLKACSHEILELVGEFNKTKMDKNDFDEFLQDLIDQIDSKIRALNKELICVSPQIVSVTITQDKENPYKINITTSADKDRLNKYVETLKARLQSKKAQENLHEAKPAKRPDVKPSNPNVNSETKNPPKTASWRDRCPVCKNGTLSPCTEKKLFGLVNESELRCQHCGAVFTQKGQNYALSRVSDTNDPAWKNYGKQALAESEWTSIANGGMSQALQRTSDLNNWLADARAGNVRFTEPSSPVILKNNEKAVLVLNNIAFWEPRAVRQTSGMYGGPSIRVAKGVSFRVGGVQARSESHEELRQIDSGVLTLTTRRLIFAGSKRTTNIDLKKILSIEAYKDGIASQRENKQKTEYFLNTDKSSLNVTAHGNHYNLPVNGVVLKAIVEGMIKQL